MANDSGGPLLSFIRRLPVAHGHSELPDVELLRRFAVTGEESAFVALMHRHGAMVLSVCQSVLREGPDAEDAFQATFLVLVRSARTIRKPPSLASWLHGVAHRLATKVRAEAARRRAHERKALPMPNGEPHQDVDWRDLRPMLHDEVARLPERYRLPFVLCHLEGKTNEEAAGLLGLPRGTILSRLSRARERLRGRLERRGLAPTSASLAALLARGPAGAAVPAVLAEGTLRAALAFTTSQGAAGGVAAPVLALVNGSLRAAALTVRLKLTAGVALAAALAAAGAGMLVVKARAPGGDGGAPGRGQAVEAAAHERPRPNGRSSAPSGEDTERARGAWVVATAEHRGRATDALTSRSLVLAGDRFTLGPGRDEVGGIIPRRALEGSVTLAPGSPNRIDLIDQAGWRLRGIYDLRGDDLRICLSEESSEERPAEFTTGPAVNQLLLGLKRE
jgi:RNA polymerase sigma factor (sigma-70 family)